MKFDLTEMNPPVRCWFDEKNKKGGYVDLRVCNGAALQEIRAQTVSRQVEYVGGQRYEYKETDAELEQSLIWDYCIIGWDGVEDQNDRPIPVSRENKVLLMLGSLKFSRFINKQHGRIAKDASELKKQAEEN